LVEDVLVEHRVGGQVLPLAQAAPVAAFGRGLVEPQASPGGGADPDDHARGVDHGDDLAAVEDDDVFGDARVNRPLHRGDDFLEVGALVDDLAFGAADRDVPRRAGLGLDDLDGGAVGGGRCHCRLQHGWGLPGLGVVTTPASPTCFDTTTIVPVP